MMFKDREEAGILLAEKLLDYKGKDNVLVLAIPRGGLPLGAIVASALNAPLDVVLTKKIGHPYNKEYAIGALSLESIILSEAAENVSKAYIEGETLAIREKLQKRHEQYYKNKTPESIEGKIVIVIDDGIATGNTILATIELINKSNPEKIIIAIPVAPPSGVSKLKNSPSVDEVICLLTPHNFHAVGQFYDEFNAVSDEEAIQLLEASKTSKV